MASPLLHRGATVRCSHQGSATPLSSNPRVRVGGQDTIVLIDPYVVECGSNPPCATATFTFGAQRLRSNGQPVVLTNSPAVCAPTGASLATERSQERVKGI